MNAVFGPAFSYLRASLAAHYARAKSEDTERGASVVEWVVISAIVVVIIAAISLWLVDLLEKKGAAMCNSIQTSSGPNVSTQCPAG